MSTSVRVSFSSSQPQMVWCFEGADSSVSLHTQLSEASDHHCHSWKRRPATSDIHRCPRPKWNGLHFKFRFHLLHYVCQAGGICPADIQVGNVRLQQTILIQNARHSDHKVDQSQFNQPITFLWISTSNTRVSMSPNGVCWYARAGSSSLAMLQCSHGASNTTQRDWPATAVM